MIISNIKREKFTVHKLRILFSLLPIFVSLCVLAFLQDSSQIGLLKELLDLQKDMVVMLLSLLEGMLSTSD